MQVGVVDRTVMALGLRLGHASSRKTAEAQLRRSVMRRRTTIATAAIRSHAATFSAPFDYTCSSRSIQISRPDRRSAEDRTFAPEPMTYTFKLHKASPFHDGTRYSADCQRRDL